MRHVSHPPSMPHAAKDGGRSSHALFSGGSLHHRQDAVLDRLGQLGPCIPCGGRLGVPVSEVSGDLTPDALGLEPRFLGPAFAGLHYKSDPRALIETGGRNVTLR